jgi:hypothetical protein
VVDSRAGRALAILVVGLACAVVAQAGSAQTVTERLPDLVADPPARPLLATYAHPDGTTHLLLRFDGFVHNQGVGAFEMRGSQPAATEMSSVVQRVYRSDGSFLDDSSRDPRIIWEPDDDHNHWHLKNAARYSLWNSDKTAEVAPALKVGFCLIDSTRIETHGPSTRVYTTGANNFCGQDEPARQSIVEGVSAGWRDLYDRTLAFQWVDVTDVQPGVHWLRAEIDPDDVVRESAEANAAAFATSSSTIPGYRALPVNAGVVSASGPTTVNLATQSFGSGLGARAFRIIAPPRHGRLSQPVGPTFSSSTVTYTPNPGWVGPDSFSYEARDSASAFPRYPANAAVTLNVGGVSPSVALSGAPASMTAGTSARLFATVIGDDPRVDWAIDGISGGSAQTGQVDPTGLYLAPAQAPPSGSVAIRATSPSGAWDEVTIAITDPAAPQAAPATTAELATIEAAPGPTAEPDPGLQGVAVVVEGRFLRVSARSGTAGVVRVRARAGARRLGHCRIRTPAGRPFTCRLRIPRAVAARTPHATLALRAGGRPVEVVETDAERLRHRHR